MGVLCVYVCVTGRRSSWASFLVDINASAPMFTVHTHIIRPEPLAPLEVLQRLSGTIAHRGPYERENESQRPT